MLSTGILICCTVPPEAVPFVYLASVCWSPQCLVSTRTQAGGGGLLFRFASSLALQGGSGAAFPSMQLRLPAVLYGVCPALRAVPALRCSTKARTQLRLRSVPSPAQAAQAARSLTGALPRVPCAFCPPQPQPQSPPAPVRCMHPVSSRDPPGGC